MDTFFGIGLPELILIAVVALIVLGPTRLPGAMRELAKYIRTIRSLSEELTSQFKDEFELLDEMNPRRIMDEATKPLPKDKDKKKTAAKKSNKAAVSASPPATQTGTVETGTVETSTVETGTVETGSAGVKIIDADAAETGSADVTHAPTGAVATAGVKPTLTRRPKPQLGDGPLEEQSALAQAEASNSILPPADTSGNVDVDANVDADVDADVGTNEESVAVYVNGHVDSVSESELAQQMKAVEANAAADGPGSEDGSK